ncbi:hypothetical protein Dtox_3245 [Desulfofarcimen acetoxidans DSM 771]|uniref:Bacterial repeat domain-containing protein n=1 Tax=Desulfofarcimen acetoxidans (strain ATCC 49208 / DSM 771 / KCTC 5769 / VKM B-1644 / 5575) TaxID=485916 RepID=C8W4U4_DESAS|nr:prepilin-type N-terminal cleavage/methylation domain-containing protein [Desulfofarcimen acetoxidans]ACV63980.1 hypothetical protein Dtox_3245 [Desulfofarcimen acetoxidans DSM 771]
MVKLSLNDKGFTLVELLIALALISLVIVLSYTLYFYSFNSFNIGTSQANLQQNARLVDEELEKWLRNAGELEISSENKTGYDGTLKLENNTFLSNDKAITDNSISDVQFKINKESGKPILLYKILCKNGAQEYEFNNQILLNNVLISVFDSSYNNYRSLKDFALYYKKDMIQPATSVQYALTIDIEGQGSTNPSSGDHYYYDDTEILLEVTPASGWEFVKWVINDADVTNPKPTINMNKNITAKVYFAEITQPPVTKQYSLVVSSEGQGIIEPSNGNHAYDDGTLVSLSATPVSGWEFVKWVIDGVDYTNPNHTVTMDANKTAKAYFTIKLNFPWVDINGDGFYNQGSGDLKLTVDQLRKGSYKTNGKLFIPADVGKIEMNNWSNRFLDWEADKGIYVGVDIENTQNFSASMVSNEGDITFAQGVNVTIKTSSLTIKSATGNINATNAKIQTINGGSFLKLEAKGLIDVSGNNTLIQSQGSCLTITSTGNSVNVRNAKIATTNGGSLLKIQAYDKIYIEGANIIHNGSYQLIGEAVN